MIGLRVILEGDGVFQDWKDQGKRFHHERVSDARITGLARGMKSGKPSVVIGADLGDGTVVAIETSLALFLTAADALRARYGDPRV